MPELSPTERFAIALGRAANESAPGRRAQMLFHDYFTRRWVNLAIGRRVYLDNIEAFVELNPDRGVMLCANHRSFFDMYVAMLSIFKRECRWFNSIVFPVRSEFFYERPLGVVMNMAIGGGTMYPPIFRDRKRAAYNDDAIERLKQLVTRPGAVVGMHPEGTRNKGDDPYKLLPAQPGAGQIALQAKPIVMTYFMNGLTNAFVKEVRHAYRPGTHRTDPVILTFGTEPVDYSDLAAKKPRLALYKKTSDRIMANIAALGERERELRDRIVSGDIGDDDPGWLHRHNGA